MGFLHSRVTPRGNQEAANATTGGRKRHQEETSQGSSLDWGRGQDLAGTVMGPPKMEARDWGL